MNIVRIQTTIDSETLHLPELREWIGKTVEIVITEQPTQAQSEDRWKALDEIAGKDLIDPEAYKQLRKFDEEASQPPVL